MTRVQRWIAASLVAAALAMAGCTSVRVSHVGHTMVDVENNGWFLFNLIPLASGDTDNPESRLCKLFQNSVTLDNNIDLINYAMTREGAVGVRDLVSYSTDEYVLFILLKRHSMHTSAELVMPETADRVRDLQIIDPRKLRDWQNAEINTGDDETMRAMPAARAGRGDPRMAEPKIKLINF
ncbi:MAG: hypothetical protein J6P13_07640 [Kiritimatiellae bacterium]|nr:hypothetical protein [Kiritimatiellia bacterium]